MKATYEFSVLRYIHDPVTQEFVNVGVVVYAPTQKFLRACCTSHYSRITKLFHRFDGPRFRQTLRHIQDELNEIGAELERGLLFDSALPLDNRLAEILPIDDSALQFAKGGVGISSDMAKTTDQLFNRYVSAYANFAEEGKREDEDVWKTFRAQFDRRNLTTRLRPKRIVAKDYEYEFSRAWKNGLWNVYESLSFDLHDSGTMLDKANRWIGRATSLTDSSEPFKMFFLLGPPTDPRFTDGFHRAQNLLKKIPGRVEFVQESEAEALADELQGEMKMHPEAN